MLYFKCPTCHEDLSHIEILYEGEMKNLCDEFNIDDDIVSKEYAKNRDDYKNKQKEIIDKLLPPDKYCCRMRLITYLDLVKIIKGNRSEHNP